MEVLTADIWGVIFQSLGDVKIAYVSVTCKDLKDTTDRVQTNFYWRSLANNKMEFPLTDPIINLPWREFYTELTLGRKEQFAVGKFFTQELICSWIDFRVQKTLNKWPRKKGKKKYKAKDLNKLLRGLIESDRVEIYDWCISYINQSDIFTQYIGLGDLLKSNGGWKLLTREIPKIILEIFKPKILHKFLDCCLVSADIVHYMLCISLAKSVLSPNVIEEVLKKCSWMDVLRFVPENASFYASIRPVEMTETLDEYSEYLGDYMNRNIVNYTAWEEFIRTVVLHASLENLEDALISCAQRYRHPSRRNISFLLQIIMKDPRITPEVLLRTVVKELCDNGDEEYNGKDVISLDEFLWIYKILHFELSVYITAGIASVADDDLLKYILSQRLIPECVLDYFVKLLSLSHLTTQEIRLPARDSNLPQFAGNETLKIVEGILSIKDIIPSNVSAYLLKKFTSLLYIIDPEEDRIMAGIIENTLKDEVLNQRSASEESSSEEY